MSPRSIKKTPIAAPLAAALPHAAKANMNNPTAMQNQKAAFILLQ